VAAEPAKGRRWWAPIGAGALLCLGCCLVPLLIAAGVLGTGSLLAGLSRLEPLGFALIGIGAAGLIWSRARARRTGCGHNGRDDTAGSCASTGCGCASTTA
jgi:uncharacterized RDD family membrane protein YckC